MDRVGAGDGPEHTSLTRSDTHRRQYPIMVQSRPAKNDTLFLRDLRKLFCCFNNGDEIRSFANIVYEPRLVSNTRTSTRLNQLWAWHLSTWLRLNPTLPTYLAQVLYHHEEVVTPEDKPIEVVFVVEVDVLPDRPALLPHVFILLRSFVLDFESIQYGGQRIQSAATSSEIRFRTFVFCFKRHGFLLDVVTAIG